MVRWNDLNKHFGWYDAYLMVISCVYFYLILLVTWNVQINIAVGMHPDSYRDCLWTFHPILFFERCLMLVAHVCDTRSQTSLY